MVPGHPEQWCDVVRGGGHGRVEDVDRTSVSQSSQPLPRASLPALEGFTECGQHSVKCVHVWDTNIRSVRCLYEYIRVFLV